MWLRLPSSEDLIIIGIGLAFFAATVWEWRKGYKSVKGHFGTPFYWKSSLAIRFVFSSVFILLPFITTEKSEIINRTSVYQIGFVVMFAILIIILIYSLWSYLTRR